MFASFAAALDELGQTRVHSYRQQAKQNPFEFRRLGTLESKLLSMVEQYKVAASGTQDLGFTQPLGFGGGLRDGHRRTTMTKATPHRRTGTSAALIAFFAVLIGMAQPSMATQPQVQLTEKEVKALVAGAKAPEDHMKLVAYFNKKADQLEAESREHEALAEKYRNDPISQGMAMKMPMSGRTAAHCEYFAKSTSEAAKKQHALAAAHEKMAKDASR